MSLIKKADLQDSINKLKKLKVSHDDLSILIDRKILIDFEPGCGVLPLIPTLELACQIMEPGSLVCPEESDLYGAMMFRKWHSQELKKYHLLRFEEKMGLFIELDECPPFLIQLILQELSSHRLQKEMQQGPPNNHEELRVFHNKIGHFDISIIMPQPLYEIVSCKIRRIADSFIPSTNTLVTLWFHGAKSQALGPIMTALCYTADSQNVILDVFAGSCAVSSRLANYRPTIANDAEIFSTEIAKALIANVDATLLERALEKMHDFFEENVEALEKTLDPHVKQEESLLWGPVTSHSIQEYQRIMDQYPIYSDDRPKWSLPENECISWEFALKDIEERRRNPQTSPYCLITYYFANAYFGLKQAIELDSIRYSIDRVIERNESPDKRKELRSLLVAALLSVASTMSSAPGHFAEYQRKFSIMNARKTWAKRREKNAWNLFCERVRYFANEHPPFLIEAYNEDWTAALAECDNRLESAKVTTVYADPPMSDFQYSRFYHVLTTIHRYDYPNSHGRGLYRGDRFSSKFSSRARAGYEMETFIRTVSEREKDLILNYKPNGLVTLSSIYSFMYRFYDDVVVLSYEVVHSSQGKKRSKTPARTFEILFVGRHPNKSKIVYENGRLE